MPIPPDSTDSTDLRSRLAHVRWLGGSACAGKTSAACRIAASRGIAVVHTDDLFPAHRERVDPERHPFFAAIRDLTPEALWSRPPEIQVAELLGFYGEEFAMLVDDLLRLTPREPVLVEGAGLLPAAVHPLLAAPGHALWLIAEPAFQRRESRRRGSWVEETLGRSADPETIFDNWMERDAKFARHLAAEAAGLGLAVLRIDGGLGLEEVAVAVAAGLGLGGAAVGVGL